MTKFLWCDDCCGDGPDGPWTLEMTDIRNGRCRLHHRIHRTKQLLTVLLCALGFYVGTFR